MITVQNPVCVALDTPDVARACDLAHLLQPHVGMLKIGMEFFYRNGPAGYEAVAGRGIPVFIDLKLHDIPNTVAQGLTSLLGLTPCPAIVNIHASGGPAMIEAAARAVDGRAKLIAVTILTSLSDDDLKAAGFDPARDTADHACALARLAQQSGADGMVCSPLDLAGIRRACGGDFLTVVPGIRPAGNAVLDQKRIATPAAARAAGADILVIGRPITQADDPAAAARAICAELDGA
jgi:orotidine-5'-phosphate decarboxylase